MKLTKSLARSQLKVNRRRTMWTVLGIVLTTMLITGVYGLVASSFAMVEMLWHDSNSRGLYEAMFASFGTILNVVVIGSSVIVLSNAFRVSVRERTMQFGILKSVGATKKQIQQTVISESLQLSVFAIPLGMIAGLVVQWTGVWFINHFLGDLFRSTRPDVDIAVPFVLSWQALLLSVVLAVVTVTLSAWLPARKAARMPAIDAIRGAGEVKTSAKVRGGWLIGRLFGIEGKLAARNLRRSRRNFRATVVALSLSVMLFITLGSFVGQMNQLMELSWPEMDANVVFRFMQNSSNVIVDGETGEVIDEQATAPLNWEIIDYLTARFSAHSGNRVTMVGADDWMYSTVLPANMLVPEELEFRAFLGDDYHYDYFGGHHFGVSLIAVDSETYARLAEMAGVPYGSNILINHRRTHTEDGRRWEYQPIRFTGQTLTLRNHDGGENRQLELHGSLGLREVPIEILHFGISGIGVIVPEANLRTLAWYIDSSNPSGFIDYTWQLLGENDLMTQGGGSGWSSFNIEETRQFERAITSLVTVFVWGFVLLLTLIYLTNIISTITANVHARAGEFAVLQSTGMTRGGIRRILGLESILASIKALIFGIPLGILGARAVHSAISEATRMRFAMPWLAIGLSVMAVFALTAVVMQHAARQLRKRNIVDTIRSGGGM